MTMEVGKVSINKMGFEETELRLGLPGNAKKGGDHQHQGDQVVVMMMRNKRGFSETVDLKLNFSNSSKDGGAAAAADHDDHDVESSKDSTITGQKNLNLAAAAAADAAADPAKPPAKAQVVGWPPVRSFRKNILATQKTSDEKSSGGNARFVKVSMDGAPYLRKVDLKMYTTYHQLSDALSNMFSSFTIGSCGSQGMRDYFSNESKLMDLLNGTDYVPTYEDKDGDWMLVGDVPWEMFVESCKRLRIMKGKEATGLAPRAMEKCKNRGLINN